MQELEKVMNEFVTESTKRYTGYGYSVGYLMSVIQIVAIDDPKLAERLTRIFQIALEDYK